MRSENRNLFVWGRLAAAAVFALLCASSARAGSITVLVGDMDGYGFATPCPDVGTCSQLSNPSIDNRTAADMVATNGAQYTDVYSALFPGNGPNTTSTGDILFPFTGTLLSGTISIAAGDFQSDVFGAFNADVNGVSESFYYADGRFVTAIHTITLSAAELTAANLTGVVDLHLDRNGSGDYVAFDWFELDGVTSAVPEPRYTVLLGAALLVFGLTRRAWNRKSTLS